jgi:very-short-patch-repair endonuclease
MLEEHAARQHSLFTLAQALDAGFTRPRIRRKLEAGEWVEVEPRVYRTALSGPLTLRGRLLAVLLSTGAVASHRSAGALHKLLPFPERAEIIAARSARTRSTAWAYSTKSLEAIDVVRVDRIPTTAPARTLIDLAGILAPSEFEDALDLAIVTRVVRPARLRARARELWAPRRNGCAVVLDLLDERDPARVAAHNVWEARVLRMIRASGLPDPQVNAPVRVGGRTRYLDFAWRRQKVAVEFDGFVPHSSRRVFDDDRDRQNDLVDDDWLLFRLTKTALERNARVALRPVERALAKRMLNGTPAL